MNPYESWCRPYESWRSPRDVRLQVCWVVHKIHNSWGSHRYACASHLYMGSHFTKRACKLSVRSWSPLLTLILAQAHPGAGSSYFAGLCGTPVPAKLKRHICGQTAKTQHLRNQGWGFVGSLSHVFRSDRAHGYRTLVITDSERRHTWWKRGSSPVAGLRGLVVGLGGGSSRESDMTRGRGGCPGAWAPRRQRLRASKRASPERGWRRSAREGWGRWGACIHNVVVNMGLLEAREASCCGTACSRAPRGARSGCDSAVACIAGRQDPPGAVPSESPCRLRNRSEGLLRKRGCRRGSGDRALAGPSARVLHKLSPLRRARCGRA